MCLIIDSSKNQKAIYSRKGRYITKCVPITVEKDIPVYKVILTDGRSKFQKFLYKPNTLYRKRKLRPTKEAVFGAAFHAYLHEINPYNVGTDYMVVKMIVPKGATVFFSHPVNGGKKPHEIATNMIRTLDFPELRHD